MRTREHTTSTKFINTDCAIFFFIFYSVSMSSLCVSAVEKTFIFILGELFMLIVHIPT